MPWFDFAQSSLPDGFYNKQASLYIMDAESQRFVLKPKGMGQRSAGHLNLNEVKPSTAFMGVRMSWDMLDRKVVLDSLAI